MAQRSGQIYNSVSTAPFVPLPQLSWIFPEHLCYISRLVREFTVYFTEFVPETATSITTANRVALEAILQVSRSLNRQPRRYIIY